MTTTSIDRSTEDVTGPLAERLFEAGLGAFELITVALGERLGPLPRAGRSWSRYRGAAGHGCRGRRPVHPRMV
jgi:hypothetical protein